MRDGSEFGGWGWDPLATISVAFAYDKPDFSRHIRFRWPVKDELEDTAKHVASNVTGLPFPSHYIVLITMLLCEKKIKIAYKR